MSRLATFAGWVLTAVAGTLLLAMMLLTVVDVVGRYVFAAPVPGAFEATEVMLALSIFAGLPLVTARGEHITVRLAIDPLPTLPRRVLLRIADAVTALALGYAAFLLYQRGAALARYGDATVLLGIALAPVAFALSALAAAAAVAGAVRTVALTLRPQ